MKKFLIASGVAVLAFASIAGAQTFNANLTVGSTGADVVALQTALISAGYSIPSIASGAASKGYFGSQTQAAVKAYQTAKGVPSTGFVGPLTRAALNGGVASAPVSMGCPVGMVCYPAGTTPTTPVVGGPTGVTTIGIPGTVTYSLQSTFNNSTLDKGKSVDVARYKLQASASDMQVTSLSFDVNKRLWLYASSITIKDDMGVVVASKTGLSSSDFSELTVGSSYRITIPVNYVVAKAATKYLTVNVTALSATDRTTAETIAITQSQSRAVDGTGVTDTETDNASTNATMYPRNISWTGSSNANIVTTIDASSPSVGLVQVSTSVETDNVPMGVFSIKSQNVDTLLRTLKVFVNSNTGPAGVATLFNDIKIKIAGNTYSADDRTAGSSSTTVTFQNLNINLPKDTYVAVTVLGKVAKNVSGSATTTLVANTTNIVVEDSSYASVTVTGATIAANAQTFTVSGVGVTGLAVTADNTLTPNAGGISRIAHYKFTLTAGDSAIYVSKDPYVAFATSTTGSTVGTATTSALTLSVDNTSGDQTTYFNIAPGQSKTFTVDYKATGSSATASSAFLSITGINFGTATNALTAGQLNASDIASYLKLTFF